MQNSPRSTVLRYGGATAAVVLATAVRLALDPALGDLFPFATLFLAVLVVAGYAGRGPALLATAIGAVASARFLLPPRGAWAVQGFENRAGLALYLGVGLGIALLGGALREARRRAEGDADERRRAEAEARRAGERARTILESITDAFAVFDRDWRFVYLNRQGEVLLGRTRNDLIGKNHWEEYPDTLGTEVEREYRRAVTENVAVTFEAYFPPHGRWYEIRGYPSPDGLSVYFRDVTRRKRSEADRARLVAASEQQSRTYETALSNTPDFNYIIDLEGRFTFVNATLLNLWRKELGEAVGKDFYELGYPPELAARLHRQIREVIDSKRPVRDETPFTSHLGERQYEYILVPIPGADGAVEGVAGSTRDVTDRKQAEDRLRDLAADLSEADRRKDEFLATLAHELRNPLAPIRNGLQILRLAGDDRAAADEARSLMERQVSHMVRLIDDLLDVSRITRGSLELRRERVDLAAVVRTAVETSRPLVEASGHRLTVTLPARPVVVDADPTRLSQVLSNLLNNAARYTEAGGEIALAADRRGDDVVVTVRDDGVGIPAEMLARVFDMFTQVDRSLERSQGGLGIGLTLVKRLVEMHGGSVEARSEGPGLGSEFAVRLPVVPASPSAAPPPPGDSAGEPAPPAGRRILVVDDNHDAARTLARLLKMTGNECRTAHDGREALTAAEEYRPEVVLLDIGLPVMNGYDVARAIRERPWGRDVAIVALTGWGQDGDRRRSKAAGIDHHLVKPVEPDVLEALLAEVRPGRDAAPVGADP